MYGNKIEFFTQVRVNMHPFEYYTLTIMCIICNTPIEKLQRATQIYIKECNVIEIIPSLPNLRILGCYECENLKKFEALPRLEELKMALCNNLESVPVFPSLVDLSIDVCKNIQSIGQSDMLQSVKLQACAMLESLPVLPNLRRLFCSLCPTLRFTEEYPALSVLTLRFCGMEHIPVFPRLSSLQCNGCKNVKAIPTMPSLRRLVVDNCDSLERIDTQPAVIKADIKWCDMLTTMFESNTVHDLTIAKCQRLEIIPSYPRLTELCIVDAERLHTIPGMPSLQVIAIEKVGVRALTGFATLFSIHAYNVEHLVKIENTPHLESCTVKNAYMLISLPDINGVVTVENCPWVSTPSNPLYQRNISGLRKIQRQMKVSMLKRRMVVYTTLKKKTPLPADICRLISLM